MKLKNAAFRALEPIAAMFSGLGRHGYLIYQLTALFIQRRYKGPALGLLWAVITPLAMLLVYTVAFSYILGISWGEENGGGHAVFALALFCGLLAFDFFSDSAVRSCDLMASHPSFIKKTIFPVHVLPAALVLSNLFDSLARLAVLCLMTALFTGGIPKTAFLVIAAYVPLILLTLGCSFFLAALGAFYRDAAHAAAILAQMLFFLTPVFYPPKMIPGILRPVLMLNPLAQIVEFFRCALIWGQGFSWTAWLLVTAASLAVCLGGRAFFMKHEKDLADTV